MNRSGFGDAWTRGLMLRYPKADYRYNKSPLMAPIALNNLGPGAGSTILPGLTPELALANTADTVQCLFTLVQGALTCVLRLNHIDFSK